MRSIIAFSTALGVAAFASNANATGLSTARFGGEHGHPMTDNPTAIYYNPGGIGMSKGVNIFLDGNFAWRVATFEHDELCPAAAEPQKCGAADTNEFGEAQDAIGSNYGKGSLTNMVAAPMLGATVNIPIGEDYALGYGAAFFVPFGGSSSWDKNDAYAEPPHPRYPGPVDGVQRWWAIDGTLRSLFISNALSFSIHDFAHIGLSGGVAISKVNTIRAKSLDNSNNLAAEGRAWIDADDINAHLGGGVVLMPFRNDELRIGFSYQMPVGVQGVTMQGTLSINDGFGNVTENDVELQHVWPDVFRLGASYKPMPELELRLFGDMTRWNLLEDQCITEVGTPECRDGEGQLVDEVIINLPRNWNVGVGVRAGASYWLDENIEVFGGMSYDSNAVPDSTMEPALMDFHDIGVSAGGRFGFTDWLAMAVSYTQLFYIPRDTTGKSELAQQEPASLGPDAGGKYSQMIGFLNLNFQASFDPFADDEPEDQTANE